MSVRRQCELLGLCRSSLYYEPAAETAENLRLMRLIDQEYTAHPILGSRRLTKWLIEPGEPVNRKRVQRLMRRMGLEAIYPKPKLSAAGRGHRIYPYLLRDVKVERPDQVWSADITYVPLARGFMYLGVHFKFSGVRCTLRTEKGTTGGRHVTWRVPPLQGAQSDERN